MLKKKVGMGEEEMFQAGGMCGGGHFVTACWLAMAERVWISDA
ncbi:MAG TPA: hypothetical protein PLM41_11570 [Saprospiraceae bacterium]|nr:hypothetical protein [Saprospiraceae bacterium]